MSSDNPMDASSEAHPAGEPGTRRLRVEVRGAVQGVGFRPFVYRLAGEQGLAGWVLNDARGVDLEVEGATDRVARFLDRLTEEAPPRAVILSLEPRWLEPAGFAGFEIRRSEESGGKTAVILPDVATCGDCLREVLDPGDRRFGYPFTNCTNCGPRFSIILELPYDRPNTTMRRFRMCARCAAEYDTPADRRFHAQPNACPECGPRLGLLDAEGATLARNEGALERAAAALLAGSILAVKGLGGFHLMVRAADETAVARLRRRKRRYEKPLALMASDVAQAARLCRLPEGGAELLASPEAPIVLLERREGARVAPAVAPGNPWLGVMLAYTPLHHLLLAELGEPVVATSGNLSDEPICTDDAEALTRLSGIADLFLVHDRPIARHVDDSVMAWIEGRPQPLRRARGLAPLPVVLERAAPTLLAVGGHFKNAVALTVGDKVFVSQHIGDMETPQAFGAFEAVIRDFLAMYDVAPVALAHDLHPDYPATRWALGTGGEGPSDPTVAAVLEGLPRLGVQHHHAHLASCLAEHRRAGPALGVTWDGTGYGSDGTIWGGEFLLGDAGSFTRVARLRPFRLLGGEAAVKEPRRSALALLEEALGPELWGRAELAPVATLSATENRLFGRMLETGLHSPTTTSAGRLFDGVASILDLGQTVSFEGQAAMALEFAADARVTDAYPLPVVPVPGAGDGGGSRHELDWRPLIAAVVEESRRGVEAGIIAARFHNALVEAIVATAEVVGERCVALTGGCFQNRLLSERAAHGLRRAGFDVLLHRQVPANDGGIALGQAAVAAARLATPTKES